MPHNSISPQALRADEKLRETAQDLWVLKWGAKRLSYRGIAKLHGLPLGTVFDYVKAYDEIAGEYRDEPNVERELTFIEATIEELVVKRATVDQEAKNYGAEYRGYTREIGTWIDRYYRLAGLARPEGGGDVNIFNFFELVKRARGESDHISAGRFSSGGTLPGGAGGLLPRDTGDGSLEGPN